MRVPCDVTEDILEDDDGREAVGVRVTCGRCGHAAESFGTSHGSVRRCLAMLREECPNGESNFYTDADEPEPQPPRPRPALPQPVMPVVVPPHAAPAGAVRLTFGAHRGELLEDVDEDYLRWLITAPNVRPELREAVRRQLGFDDAGLTETDLFPRVIFDWWLVMRARFPADPAMAVVAAGLETFKQLCSQATGRPWPDDTPLTPELDCE